jgi:hypothetical protein
MDGWEREEVRGMVIGGVCPMTVSSTLKRKSHVIFAASYE